MYDEQDFLLLSGISHFCFCRRRWALIHIEEQWKENLHTAEGRLMHERAHESMSEKRGDLLIIHNMPVFSRTLGITGACDIVEFNKDANGVVLHGRYGTKGIKYIPYPVEYKKGKPKQGHEDILQLCAQAMCIEEMLVTQIKEGSLYYGKTKHRLVVELTDELRKEVTDMLKEMHEYYSRGYTPKSKPNKACKECSLSDICLPKLVKRSSVSAYLAKYLTAEPEDAQTS
jgi:CRISPR-associated exonuclease Cas4